jgi:hypothetical protein
MTVTTRAGITAVASYLPTQVLTTAGLQDSVERASGLRLPPGLFGHMSGITHRRVAAPHEYASTLATQAARTALAAADLDPLDIDLLLFASATRDMVEPATAHIVQADLGSRAHALDVTNACNSFLNGIDLARACVVSGRARRVLVVTGETPTRAMRPTLDSAAHVRDAFAGYTFGDAGAAAVVEPVRDGGIIDVDTETVSTHRLRPRPRPPGDRAISRPVHRTHRRPARQGGCDGDRPRQPGQCHAGRSTRPGLVRPDPGRPGPARRARRRGQRDDDGGATMMWVIVPAYNDAARIPATLRSLAAQTDLDFTLLVVDNNSLDGTPAVARDFARDATMPVHLLVEPEKGVGCAVDSGFRYAIAAGATMLARTDADCLPQPGWVAAARAALMNGAGMVCGRITARHDEHGPLGRAGFRLAVAVAAAFGRIRPAHRRRNGFRAPYRTHAGNNMAITADLYVACGGMPRRPSPTDRAFLNRVRRTTDAIVYSTAMVVENSTRRLRAYGLVGTARWYLNHGSGRLTPDPR